MEENGCQKKNCLKIKKVMVFLQLITLGLLVSVLISIVNM